ncbi:hypothetical protein LCGC14_1997470 [marine sediment metagenome]|uniref:Uncharacterized protein n=1 Tax=marine sediment metagenome TaxID=412755 RepID=A0A0F9F402_9ZZZZ
MIPISQEPPPYLICPNCKEKILLTYSEKRHGYPKTDDIYSMIIITPEYDTPSSRIHISICNHCKVILGTGTTA